MSFKSIIALALLSIIVTGAAAESTKVVILNDLHLDPYFDVSKTEQDDCRGPNPFSITGIKDTNFAPYGRYGCDVPSQLINEFMERIKSMAFDPDVILVSGDYTAHDIAAKKGRADENYAVLKATIADCFAQYINPMFENATIIPTIGNNDVKWHYEYPQTPEEAAEYYGFLYNLWFVEHNANREKMDLEKVKETFMNGGYFAYNYSDDLTFLAINSLYFSVKNEQYNSTVSSQQLDWIEDTLRNSEENRKFILNMHVFPGMYNPGERQQFWEDEFNNRFDDIMRELGHKVLMLNGAHTHISDVRASAKNVTSTTKSFLKEVNEEVNYYANFVSPSFSPFYLNNPGFTSFNIDNGTIHNVTTHFFELDLTYSREEGKNSELVFHSVNYETEFGITTWSPDSIRDFMARARADDALFTKFLVLKLGYRLDQQEEALKVYENLNMIDFSNDNRIYWCFFQFVRSDDYDACVSGNQSAI